MRVEIFSDESSVSLEATGDDNHFHLSCSPKATEAEIAEALADLAATIKKGEESYQSIPKEVRKGMAAFVKRVVKSILISQSAIKSPLGPRAN